MDRQPNRTFDWRPNPDPRSMMWRVSGLSCFAEGVSLRNVMRKKTVFLNQYQEGACTGFGAEHVRALSPHSQVTNNRQARAVYKRAQTLDEWPGEDYEGSSVNGAMKAERELSRVVSWHWCLNLSELDHALSYHGAVEAGTWWYSGMFEPDDFGMLHLTGEKAGGHAYAIAGKRTTPNGRTYRIENSWGSEWGQNGGAWIGEFDLLQLLSDGGEFACPRKVY